MKTAHKNQLRSIVVLIVAALLLELTTAVQFFSMRRSISQQLTEMAQRDISGAGRTTLLKQHVEDVVARMHPLIERLAMRHNSDSIRAFIREMLRGEQQVVGVDFCWVVGSDGRRDGLYIFKAEENGEMVEQVIDFDFTQRSWYSEGIGSDGFWSEPYKSNYREVLMCTYSRAVRDAEGRTLAVLGADVPMRELSALITQVYDNQHRMLLPILLFHILGLTILAFIIHRYVRGIRRLHDVNAEKERLTGELNIARRIQDAMQPKSFSSFQMRDDVDICALLTPAREVGGDFCDYSIRDEKLFFCIGDVSGKGVPAALVMSVARSMFRMLSARESAPDRILTAMNDTMAQDNDYNMFITMFVGVLDLPTGRLRYSNAGHKTPYVDGEPLPVNPNLPVGAFSNYRFTEQETQVSSGTTIFLYTDGLTEAEDESHNQFGVGRMEQCLQAGSPEQLIEQMTRSVKSFVGNTEQSDDLTMLAIHYIRQASDVRLFRSLTLPCDVHQIDSLAELVEEVCGELEFPASTIMQINLALEEAVVNVMNYAYPAGLEGDVTIEAMANTEQLTFTVTDSGQPFDPTVREEVDITKPAEERAIGGLGIHLMRRYMDSINYERFEGRNILTLRKRIG